MKKLIRLIPLFSLAFCLVSCGEVVSNDVTKNNTDTTETTKPNTDNNKNNVKFSISVKVKDSLYPGNGKLKVVLQNTTTTKTVELPESGVAEIEAPDGEYHARLIGTPGAYVYDPNETIVNTANPSGTIQLYTKGKTNGGNGSDKFTNVYKIDNLSNFSIGSTYYYQATIKSASDVVYYEFTPSVIGTYKIESCVDMFDNLINPKCLKYYAGPVASAFLDSEVDKGGNLIDGGFTKNFAFTFSVNSRQLGNVQKFGIKAEVNGSQTYPLTVTFKISMVGDATTTYVSRQVQYATDIYYKRDANNNYVKDSNGNYITEYEKISDSVSDHFSTDYDANHNTLYFNKQILGDTFAQSSTTNYYYKRRYSYVNGEYVLDESGEYVLKTQLTKPKTIAESGKTFTECANSNLMIENNKTVLDSTKCYLNEDNGIWYIWLDDAHTISTPLVTTFSNTTKYLEIAIDHLEDEGGTGLSAVSTNKYTDDGKQIILNYKRMIEAELTDLENGDGYCYVTNEIKEVLAIISNNNQYFFDGQGWCEQDGTYADEDSQWLFACGYYA